MDHCHHGSHRRLLLPQYFCNRSDYQRTVTTVKLKTLELFAHLFNWIWVGAAIAAVYFLYKATVNEAPLYYLLWSLVAAFIAKYFAAALNSSKEQVDYVDQLIWFAVAGRCPEYLPAPDSGG